MQQPSSDPILQAQAAENFPVASRLLAAPLRPVVHAFYRVVRGADDIADSQTLERADKEAHLNALDAILRGDSDDGATPLAMDARRLRRICRRHAYDVEPARQLIQAFLADAANRPCRTWSDLIAYCRFSAVPVGRFLLDLHDEGPGVQRASDSLCIALQILNHLQDCRADWVTLQRCYIPASWLAAEGLTPADLAAEAASPALRRVIDRVLEHVAPLLREARGLAGALSDPRLAREAAGICALADALARRLQRQDPLARRVALGAVSKAATFGWSAMALRPKTRATSGSSFRVAMRLFPTDARRAIAAIYALARRLDDIADGAAPIDRKLAAITAWRDEVAALYAGAPDDPLTRALLPWTGSLPQREILALIDGMESDLVAPAHAPSNAALQLYCRRVAGTVGVLILAACKRSSPADQAFAAALGEALQRVNILRDVTEDARGGRLYLPAEMLTAAGIDATRAIDDILRAPRFPAARRAFVESIDAAFANADRLANDAGGIRIRAVIAIAAIYRRLFERLRDAPPDAKVRLGWRDHAAALFATLRGS